MPTNNYILLTTYKIIVLFLVFKFQLLFRILNFKLVSMAKKTPQVRVRVRRFENTPYLLFYAVIPCIIVNVECFVP